MFAPSGNDSIRYRLNLYPDENIRSGATVCATPLCRTRYRLRYHRIKSLPLLSLTLAALCLRVCAPTAAIASGKAAPIILALVSDVSFDDLQTGRPAATLQPLAKQGMLALLEPAYRGQPTEASTYLSIGAGVPIAAPSSGGKAVIEAGLKRTMAEVAEDAYPFTGRESVVVAQGYRRRYGEYPPLHSVALHLGLPALRSGQFDASAASAIGALGDAFRKANLRIAVYGDWRAVSVGMDHQGAVYQGTLRNFDPEEIVRTAQETDLIIVNAPTLWQLRQCVAVIKQQEGVKEINLIIAAVFPNRTMPKNMNHQKSPGFLIGVGPAFTPGTVPVSPTMRLPGMVSSLDIAPTVASMVGTLLPGGSGVSLVGVRKDIEKDAFSALMRLNQQIVVRDRILPLVRSILIAASLLALLPFLLAIAVRKRALYSIAQFTLRFVASLPFAFLVMGMIAPEKIPVYLLGTAGIAAGLAFCAMAFRRVCVSPLSILLLLSSVTIAADMFWGQQWLYHSALYDPKLSVVALSTAYAGLGMASFLCGIGLFFFFGRRPGIWHSVGGGVIIGCLALSQIGATGASHIWDIRSSLLAFSLLIVIIACMDSLCAYLLLTMEQKESASLSATS